jgi:hypothetical protein
VRPSLWLRVLPAPYPWTEAQVRKPAAGVVVSLRALRSREPRRRYRRKPAGAALFGAVSDGPEPPPHAEETTAGYARSDMGCVGKKIVQICPILSASARGDKSRGNPRRSRSWRDGSPGSAFGRPEDDALGGRFSPHRHPRPGAARAGDLSLNGRCCVMGTTMCGPSFETALRASSG